MCNNKLSGYSNSTQDQHAYYSEAITTAQFERLLDNAFGNSTDNDLNFFYFTGHTIFESIDSISGPLGICINNKTTDNYSFRLLAQKLNSYKGRMVVILDTCGSEAFITDGINSLSNTSRMNAICSCGYLEESEFGFGYLNSYLFFNGYRYNAFTFAIGKGLGFFDSNKKLLADSNNNESVSIQELFQYAKKNTNSLKEMNVRMFSDNASVNIFSYSKAGVSIRLSETSVSIYKGKSKQLRVTITGTSKKTSWSSSNSTVALVDSNGKVTAKKQGTAVITCKIGNKKASCKVTVKNPVVVKLSINKTKASVTAGSSFTLKATVSGTSQKVTWSSSNSKVAKVKNGKVTGVKAGSAKITASVGGKKAVCTVTVKKKTSTEVSAYKNFIKKGSFTTSYSYTVNGHKYTNKNQMVIASFSYVDTNGDRKPELYVRAYKKGDNPSYATDYLISYKNKKCVPTGLEEKLTGYFQGTNVKVSVSYAYMYNNPSTPYTKDTTFLYKTQRAYTTQQYLSSGNTVYRKFTTSFTAERRTASEFYSWYRNYANNGKNYRSFVFYSGTASNLYKIIK